jgi:outer membrane protein insertion porin family
MKSCFKYLLIILLNLIFVNNISHSEILNKLTINGNSRITDETIKTFLNVSIKENLDVDDINRITKELYETNFFENVSIKFNNNELIVNVIENPIIQNITFAGINSDTLKEEITNNLKLIERSSYIKLFAEQDVAIINENLKRNGYFFSKVDLKVEELGDNRVSLSYTINLGKKSKIKKISFIGNKVFKDRNLRNVILSEEYRFWKFISKKKFLNEELVKYDERLLKNFYLNNGYYNSTITSSFAKLLNDNEFELVYNINAGQKIFFGNLSIDIPLNYDENNFLNLKNTLEEIKGKPYSINLIEKITNDIDLTVLNEQYDSVDIDVIENLDNNILNIKFVLKDALKNKISRINILGNNVTRENVIRNQFEIDEGDFYNEILYKKTLNNLRSLNFFRSVSGEVANDTVNAEKIINISVEEKPTGELGAAAGVGTEGSSIGVFIKENNYLGKGLALSSDFTLATDSIKGSLSVTNPNFNDTDKSVYAKAEISETDKLKKYGYKVNNNGFSYGTNFEFLDDLRLGVGNSNYYSSIETNSTASALRRKQEGNYWDSFINLNFSYDKRNNKFKPSDGFINRYYLDIPFISETNTLSNTFDYKVYKELYKDNVSSLSFYLQTSDSLSNDNIKLTERNFLPSNKLRGFALGGIGPKEGNDYIGGNYASSFNLSSTLPQILQENENIDFLIFFDAANVWGVDYDSTIDDSNTIRSSIGLGVDWFTPLGPLNFSLAQPLTKDKNDSTETFRFNLGTTF